MNWNPQKLIKELVNKESNKLWGQDKIAKNPTRIPKYEPTKLNWSDTVKHAFAYQIKSLLP